ETRGADLEIDLQDAAVAEWQRVLHAHAVGQPIGILDGVRLAQQVRERDRHAVVDREDGVLDVAGVVQDSHRHHHTARAVESGLKLRSPRRSPARRMWKATRRANSRISTAANSVSATRTGARRISGTHSIHTAVPSRFTKAIGTRYFQHMIIIWSTR